MFLACAHSARARGPGSAARGAPRPRARRQGRPAIPSPRRARRAGSRITSGSRARIRPPHAPDPRPVASVEDPRPRRSARPPRRVAMPHRRSRARLATRSTSRSRADPRAAPRPPLVGDPVRNAAPRARGVCSSARPLDGCCGAGDAREKIRHVWCWAPRTTVRSVFASALTRDNPAHSRAPFTTSHPPRPPSLSTPRSSPRRTPAGASRWRPCSADAASWITV